jgi:hypothetical protein
MEVIDIGANDLEPISLNFGEKKPSVNFGGGIELLINDKKRSSSNSVQLDLGELDTLENELNELSGRSGGDTKAVNGFGSSMSGFAANMFGLGPNPEPERKVTIQVDDDLGDSNLGQATRESAGSTKTWDGYSKLNDVPPSAPANPSSSSGRMSDRDRRRKTRMMIKKLEEWYEKRLTTHNSHFNMDSAYEEVEDEYETVLEEKRKKDSIKLQGWWFMTFINSLEYANAAFNPFDLNLDGWGEQVNEDLDSYEEIFSELHDKYKGGKLAPELSLLLRVGFSAAVLNFSNKALSSATPAFNDVIRQSPELMKMFTNATVNSMSQNSPGFAMANNLMQDTMNRPRGPPPPAPVETKTQAPPQRPGMVFTESASRPDLAAGRGVMFREQGTDLNNSFRDANQQDRTTRPMAQPMPQPIPQHMPQPMAQPMPQQRQEMRGPQSTDIDDILSGLKTRTVNIHEQPVTVDDEDSMISIASLKDIQNANGPKKSNRRRNRSDNNTISLDI